MKKKKAIPDQLPSGDSRYEAEVLLQSEMHTIIGGYIESRPCIVTCTPACVICTLCVSCTTLSEQF